LLDAGSHGDDNGRKHGREESKRPAVAIDP
jgi:hypothetical protein